MRIETIVRRYLKERDAIPEFGEHRVLRNWVLEDGALMDMANYGRLLKLLPDKIVNNLEKARLERAGVGPILRAGLGFQETLSSVIVDGTAIASSAAEARLVPALALPANYLAPGGLPGRTLRMMVRGRATTLTTAATMTFRWRDGATDVFTNTLAASGALTMDATIQTATMWKLAADLVVRSVGSAGTVFVMGDAEMSAAAFTLANATASFMGSAGSATPATVTLDTTAVHYFNWTGNWSLATAYSIQAHQAIFEAMN